MKKSIDSKLSNSATESEISTTKSDRRKIIKGALLGGAVTGAAGQLPTSWTKPVTDQVMLPAHGATTGAQFDARICAGIDGTWSSNNLTLDTDFIGDGTPCIRFSSGDTSGDITQADGSDVEASFYTLSIGLPEPLGDSRTATLSLNGNLFSGSGEFDFTLSANSTDFVFDFDHATDNGDGDAEINVEIPGFHTARLRIDLTTVD